MKKLQGWKERFFFMGKKEVLLKSVIQSIPTYAMSCFAPPSSIIRDIEESLCEILVGFKHKQREDALERVERFE